MIIRGEDCSDHHRKIRYCQAVSHQQWIHAVSLLFLISFECCYGGMMKMVMKMMMMKRGKNE